MNQTLQLGLGETQVTGHVVGKNDKENKMSNITEIKDKTTAKQFYIVQVLVPDDILMDVLHAIHNNQVTPNYWQVYRT